MKKGLFALLLLTTSTMVFAQKTGVIFEDMNKNNIFDKGDKPMSGVVVSDGKTSVKSDKNGVYTLSVHDKAKFVLISTPSGYTYAVDFYHRIADVTNFDFPLNKVANEARRFIQIADSETYVYADWIDDLKKYVSYNDVAFINHTGDICYEKGLNFHKENFSDKELGTRIVTSLGNHDLVGKNGSGEKMFEDLFGPVWYSFNVGGVHFVNTAMRGGDRTPSYTLDEMMEWLEGDFAQLKEGTPIVIFNHDIVFNDGKYIYKTDENEFDLNKYNLRGWFYGHWHVNSFVQFGNVKVYGTSAPDKGGIDHSPSCFRVLEFDKDGVISSELKYTSIKYNVVANITKENEVIANIYSSSADIVSAILKVGRKSYSLAKKSDWAWSVNLPKSVNAKAAVLNCTFNDGTVVKTIIDVESSQTAPALEWAENYVGGNSYMSAPIICGDNVMYATIDDNSGLKCGITAVNQKTGKLAWVFKSHNSIKNTFVTDGKYVFASDVEGYLYKVDAETGKLLGEMKLQKGVMAPNNLGIAIENGVVYSGFGDGFSAVDVETFEKKWTTDKNRGGEGTNVTITVEGDNVYTASFWNGRYATDIKTGKTLWSYPDRGAVSSMTSYKGKLYFTSNQSVYELDPKSGEEVRVVDVGFKFSTASKPIVTDKLIIVGTANEGVVALNRETLQFVWNFKTKPALVYSAAYTQNQEKTIESTLLLKDGSLYFGASDGYLYVIDYSTGVFKSRYNIGSPILSKVVIDDNDNLYVNDLGGTLYKFNL